MISIGGGCAEAAVISSSHLGAVKTRICQNIKTTLSLTIWEEKVMKTEQIRLD